MKTKLNTFFLRNILQNSIKSKMVVTVYSQSSVHHKEEFGFMTGRFSRDAAWDLPRKMERETAVSHLKARERLAMSVFFCFPDLSGTLQFKHCVCYRKEPRYVD